MSVKLAVPTLLVCQRTLRRLLPEVEKRSNVVSPLLREGLRASDKCPVRLDGTDLYYIPPVELGY